MTEQAIALLSGGLDSGVAAARFLAEGGRIVHALFFLYGQRAAPREAAASRALAGRWGAPWTPVELPWLGDLARRAGSALIDTARDLPHGTTAVPGDAASAAAVWVPARNAVFVAIGAAFAEAHDASVLIAGFNREEAATFPDNSADFLAAANDCLRHGTRRQVRVVSPTLALDKAGIVAAARDLGLGPGDFWSCYEGGEQPCGRCESCLRSRW